MNVDTQFPPASVAALPSRPVQARAEQASARPVERPHHDEPGNNQTRRDHGPAEVAKDLQRPANEQRIVRQESELSQQEKRELDKLKARDREVRAHEAAHKAAAGSLARGAAQFKYETGANGQRYAVGGEVSIDTSKIAGDPEANLHKAQIIRRAANAPAQPSAQDRQVAAEASRMETEARQELSEQRTREEGAERTSHNTPQNSFKLNSIEPVPLGELLDVTA